MRGVRFARPLETRMGAFLAKRLAQSVIVIAAVVFIVFIMMFLSGARLLLPPDASREDILELTRQMGFDRPLWEQFLSFAGNLLHGDFGRSWRFQLPALPPVLERFPATIELAAAALLCSLVIAVPGRRDLGGSPQYLRRRHRHGVRTARPIDAGILAWDHVDPDLFRESRRAAHVRPRGLGLARASLGDARPHACRPQCAA